MGPFSFLSSLSNGDIIQVIIALIMFFTLAITAYYSYKTNQENKEERSAQLCLDLISEERQIFLQLKGEKLSIVDQDNLLFSFYEQASILYLSAKIDRTLFDSYFKVKLIETYERFLKSSAFSSLGERFIYYRNFCTLLGCLGLDIKKDMREISEQQ